MKQKEKTALQSMTIAELRKHVAELAEKKNDLGLKRKTTQTKNSREGKELRKTIAVIFSMIQVKELSEKRSKGNTV